MIGSVFARLPFEEASGYTPSGFGHCSVNEDDDITTNTEFRTFVDSQA